MKNLLIYIFLGFIQGITEPIPVSSSGHILIFKKIIEKFSSSPLNLDYETFATITNFGSFIAIFIFFAIVRNNYFFNLFISPFAILCSF